MPQGVAPPVHVYEKPAGSSSAYAPVAKEKSDSISSDANKAYRASISSGANIELEGWKAGPSPKHQPNQPHHHLHHHNHRAQAKVDILTQDDLSTSADSSGNWLTKSVSVGKSITAAKPSTSAKRGEPKAEARIDLGDSSPSSSITSTAVTIGTKVSVASSEAKEKLRKGTVEDIKIE